MVTKSCGRVLEVGSKFRDLLDGVAIAADPPTGPAANKDERDAEEDGQRRRRDI
jgi:hypothetical protein